MLKKRLFRILKRIFFWNYPRNTWQWDALCVLILIFIFLTPKSWFVAGERRSLEGHQTPTYSTLLVSAEIVENEQDKGRLEAYVKTVTGRPDVKILDVRKRVHQDGRVLGYEVDIR